jgi:hypothetical protein
MPGHRYGTPGSCKCVLATACLLHPRSRIRRARRVVKHSYEFARGQDEVEIGLRAKFSLHTRNQATKPPWVGVALWKTSLPELLQ